MLQLARSRSTSLRSTPMRSARANAVARSTPQGSISGALSAAAPSSSLFLNSRFYSTFLSQNPFNHTAALREWKLNTFPLRKQKGGGGKGGNNKRGRQDDDDEEYDEEEVDEKPKKKGGAAQKGGKEDKEFDKAQAQQQFTGEVDRVKKALATILLARAEVGLLGSILVDGKSVPNMGQVQVRDPTTLLVTLYDTGNINKVLKAIQESSLGLMPSSDGRIITVPLPKITADHRKRLVQKAAEIVENTRKSIRAIRKKILDDVKKQKFPEDEQRTIEKDVQKLHDDAMKQVDQGFKKKEEELLR